MRNKRRVLIGAVAAAVSSIPVVSHATAYSWLSLTGGSYNWTDTTNWSPSGFPQVTGDAANISGAFSGPLSIALPATPISVGTLTLGDTSAAHNGITIAAGGSNFVLDSAAAASSTDGTINLVGTAGATETIAAPLQLSNTSTNNVLQYLIIGNQNLNLSGGIVNFLGTSTASFTRALVNTGGGTLILGNIALSQPGSAARGALALGGSGSITLGDPNFSSAATSFSSGTFILSGVISNGGFVGSTGGGSLTLGNTQAATGSVVPDPGDPARSTNLPVPTYLINASNSYSGNTVLGRGNFVMGTNNPFGSPNPTSGIYGTIQQSVGALSASVHFQSNDDSRILPNIINQQQNLTFDGAHSITVSGGIFQSNSRNIINNLPAGKTLTFSGVQAPNSVQDTARVMTYDGSGNTLVSGPIYNTRRPWIAGFGSTDFSETNADGSTNTSEISGVQKRGSGIVTLNPTVLPTLTDVNSVSFTGPTSVYRGPTIVLGGLLQFANSQAYGSLATDFGPFTLPDSTPLFIAANTTGTSLVAVSAGGAVALLTGATADANFIAKLNASTLSGGNTGALAPAPVTSDQTASIDFSGNVAGAINLSAPAVNLMSIGAAASGTTFTGTITPGSNAIYKLGGGGTLTMPNANALVGANAVTITNGGTVVLAGLNSYTGVTTIRGDYINTNQGYAALNAGTQNIGSFANTVRVNSALAVTTLSNGTSPSSIGSSSNSAANLVLNGGTLKYVGSGSSTDRLFTIGPVGATLDSSGSGSVNFNNGTGSVAENDAAPVTGSLLFNLAFPSGTQNAQVISNVSDTSNLTVGMVVTAADGSLQANTTITGIGLSSNNISNCLGISLPSTAQGTISTTLSFTNQNRNLTLTGSNVLSNTIAPALTDSTLGKLGVVKSGTGKWVLTGNNTYTGATIVQGGTLELGTNAQNSVLSNTAGADIQHGALVFDYSGVSIAGAIKTQLASSHANNGFNNTTNQLRSSTANASLGLGLLDNGSAVTVLSTFYGDANGDGKVNAQDFDVVAANYGQSNKFWYQGDFDYSGVVNTTDFNLLAANYNKSMPIASQSLSAPGLGTLVPEPALLSAMLLAGLAVRRRSRGSL